MPLGVFGDAWIFFALLSNVSTSQMYFNEGCYILICMLLKLRYH